LSVVDPSRYGGGGAYGGGAYGGGHAGGAYAGGQGEAHGEGGRADILVDTDPAAPVGSLAGQIAALLGRPGTADGPPALHVGGYRVDPSLPVDLSPIRDGVLVSLDDPAGCPEPEAQGLVEVRVVGGPDAGGVYRLGPGAAVAGSGPDAWIRVDDPDLPHNAIEVEVDADGACTVRPCYGASATLDGEPLTDGRDWQPGAVVAAGRSLLELTPVQFPDAALRPSEDGTGLDYNRPPRLTPPQRDNRFNLPRRPVKGDPRPLPWLMALVPLVGAVVLATLLNSTAMLAFALLSPIAMMANYMGDRKHGKKSFKRSMEEYEQRVASIERDAQDALGGELAARRLSCPDPAATGQIATGPGHRLWERRPDDADYLLMRVGTGTLPSEVVVSDPDSEEHRRTKPRMLRDVPVAVDLRERGVLGIAGRADLPRALGRWIVAQAAALHSPSDLQVYVLTDSTGRESWDWVRWLPHARPREGQNTVALLGTDADTVARRVSELLALIGARQQAMGNVRSGREARFAGPDMLVVMDGSRRLRALPGATQILRDGPAVGVYLVCLDTDVRLLPEECRAVVAADQRGVLVVSQAGAEAVGQVRPDCVSPAWCEKLARAVAPIRDVSGEDDSALPDSARLLDVLELEPPTADAVATRWSFEGRSTRAVVGVSLDGPFALDLVRDGPHGLVAGTTGSGKSELLQTLVASLAVANRPDAMTFVLVDYKGGSAFKECVKLPHTVGMVTDLDTHLVERALESLSAELRRREHMLAEAGTKDLEDYVDACGREPGLEPLPRLLIVIDEFASLARELPDFVTGLVNIAQRGRSLGIHLILATQRPGGVVSPEIRANTNLRIALRVTDPAESSDVIDTPDAARIAKSTPGRAYVRLGHSSLLPFQAGRVGGRRPGLVASDDVPAPWTVQLGWEQVGQPVPERPSRATVNKDPVTDLGVLVDAIEQANHRLGIRAQHSPWLPALPDLLVLDDLTGMAGEVSAPPVGAEGGQPGRGGVLGAVLPGPVGDAGPALTPAPFGLADLPSTQSRRVESVDLTSFGHLFVAGAPRSGRSQVLRTLAGSLADTNSCADVHLYGIDCGNGALLPLTSLPHCGAVVRSTEGERATRLINKLSSEVQRRMTMLGEGGFTDITEQRASVPAEERLPHLVVLLDRWEGFVASLGDLDNGALADAVLQLLREGASAGVHLVVTGDHTLLTGRISTLTENKLALRLSDHSDYSLIGVSPRTVPQKLAPGRAYRAGSGVATQIALLTADPAGQAQAAALASISGRATARDVGVPVPRRPFRVDVLPTRIGFDRAWELREAGRGPLWGMVAVGGDRLAALGPDLETGAPAFVIAGPPQSGRSTAVATLARSLMTQGTQVILVAPRPSALRSLAGAPSVVRLFDSATLDAEAFLDAVHRLSGPGVVLIDDAELLRDCGAGSELAALVRRELRPQLGLVIAGDADNVCSGFSGWQVDVKRARRGLLLSPQNFTDADLIGARVPRGLTGQPIQPGRGLLHLGGGDLVVVQVPLSD
jgi:S-DNA-T family DNA segregation ATPase FtsK/SpoIIIE